MVYNKSKERDSLDARFFSFTGEPLFLFLLYAGIQCIVELESGLAPLLLRYDAMVISLFYALI
jgi:hypothetical protein